LNFSINRKSHTQESQLERCCATTFR